MSDENKLFSPEHMKRVRAMAPSSVDGQDKSEKETVSSWVTSKAKGNLRPELSTLDGTYSDADGDGDGESEGSDDYGTKTPEGDYMTYSTGTTPPTHHSPVDEATSEKGEDREASEEGGAGKSEYPEVPTNDDGKVKTKKKTLQDAEDGSEDEYDDEANVESDVEEEYEDDGLGKDEVVENKGTRTGLRSADK
ncbi:uncharacterized protein PAC_03339 [Phialocephala subalpina]|uniref:Uncharacterized protein n=1 Tax=Phialocephala subalpina TaxID=576137 RepID=A0A1L7WL12_9HELO|nr:uncharacterized protein PAC_03339 [Phialocephala subalpina]